MRIVMVLILSVVLYPAYAWIGIDPNWKDCNLPENEAQCLAEFEAKVAAREAIENSLVGAEKNEYLCLVDPRSCGGGGGGGGK